MKELYRKHRPRTLQDVIGQDKTIVAIEKLLEQDNFPHAILLSGPSGCGKTTIARILARSLKCAVTDFEEVNAADSNGIDMVRGISQRMGLAPMSGECRVWLIDESHCLTKQASSSFLKMLEDTPSHVYFMLATTDPHKMLNTIRTRCTEIKLQFLSMTDMEKLIKDVCDKESIALTEEELDRLVECAEGSARKALVILHQVMGLKDESERLDAIQKSDSRAMAIELARTMMDKKKNKWSDVSKLLKEIDEEPESLRRMILGYYSAILLNGGKFAPRAADMLDLFRDHFYDCGKAGLVLSCWNAMK